MKKALLIVAIQFFALAAIYSQGTSSSSVTGQVIGSDSEALIGANVILKQGGSDQIYGAVADLDGNYSIDNVPYGTYQLEVSYTGYENYSQTVNVSSASMMLQPISLGFGSVDLAGIEIVGIADIAKERQTPVAVSTIRASEIQLKLGNQELPEILSTTPSVYATKQGGGWGDSRINIRGFDQQNTAVMINGVPINDMENGRVFWSNWAGLSDVTSAMQVQRGLGSSKLAISSIGGTINVLTKTSKNDQGGSIGVTTGNDGYLKLLASYNSGVLENGFSASVLVSNTRGNGFVDGTKFQGSNYFFGLGYNSGTGHDFQFTFTGAPQWHHQRSFAPSVGDYIAFNADNDGEPDIKYNSDWGMLDGEEFTFRRNFYHKPVMSLNWDWTISEKTSLSTVVYGSWGRGGGTGEIGRSDGKRGFDSRLKTAEGIVDFDLIKAYNQGQTVTIAGNEVTRTLIDGQYVNTGSGDRTSSNGISRRSSMNSHNWYGAVVNLKNKLTDNISWDIGADVRQYKGLHYRTLNNLVGGDVYEDNDNRNDRGNRINTLIAASPSFNPFQNITDQPRLDYNNDGFVRWAGAFTQLEYVQDKVSAFLQGSVSQQGFKRVEYFGETPENQATPYENLTGGNIKGGFNINLDDHNNFYANAGYYSKQPLFDAVYINFGNNLNPNLANEKIVGTEIGYGYRNKGFKANVNVYRTTWKDRFLDASSNFDVLNTPDDEDDDIRGVANLLGIEQIHTGIEFDFNARVNTKFNLKGMVSMGNWEYGSDVEATFFDEDQNPILVNGEPQAEVLYLDGVKVGDAAQFTAYLGADYKIIQGLSVDAGYRYAGNLYADISPEDFDTADNDGSLKLPSFGLVDAGVSYFLGIGDDKGISFRLNVNNVLDNHYISESDTNIHAQAGDEVWNGVNTSNRVFFGWGRSWNFGAKYSF